MNIKELDIDSLDIHPYALLTPKMSTEQYVALKRDIEMNGQLEPIKVTNNLVYDGRHRLMALRELKKESIMSAVDNGLTQDDIKSQVLSLENRRHQTPTQLAIMAYKEYRLLSHDCDRKVSQGEIASRFGVSRKNLGEVKSLADRAPDIIDHLFNGNKINIGSTTVPNLTNNVRAINAWIKSDRESRMSVSVYESQLTDDEHEAINIAVSEITSRYGNDMSIDIAKRIIAILTKE